MYVDDPTATYRDSNRAAARFVAWTLAWLGTLAVARFGPELAWGAQERAASWTAIGVNVLVGVAWIVAFARLLRAMDDLHRKVVQDALAITLAVGWVGGFGYVLADAAGLVDGRLDVGLFAVLLGVVYLISFAVGVFRYR